MNDFTKKMIPVASSGNNDAEDKNMNTNIAASTSRHAEEGTTSTNHFLLEERREAGTSSTIEKKRLRERQRRHEISQAVDCLFESMVQIDPQVMDSKQVLHAVPDKENSNKRRRTTTAGGGGGDAEQVLLATSIVSFQQQRGSLNRTDVINGARDMLFFQDGRIKQLEEELRQVKVASSVFLVEPVVNNYAGKRTSANDEEDCFSNEKGKNTTEKAIDTVHNINDATTTRKRHDSTNTPFQLLCQEAQQRQELQQKVSSNFVAPGRHSTTDASSLLLLIKQQAAAASRSSSQQQQLINDTRYFQEGLNPNNLHNLERIRHQYYPRSSTATSGFNHGQEGSAAGLLNAAVQEGFASSFVSGTPGAGAAEYDAVHLDAMMVRSLQQQRQRQQEEYQLGVIRGVLGVGPDCQLTPSDTAAFLSGNYNNVGGVGRDCAGSGH